MEISTKQILRILYVLSWIIFIGLCIEAGGLLFNSVYAFFINPAAANNFFNQIDLSALFNYDSGHFLVVTFLMVIVSVMKALMFYLIVKVLHDKKLNLSQPFNIEVGSFIFKLSYLALGIGIFSFSTINYSKWLISKGVQMPDLQSLYADGADVWLFMAVVLYVIAHIFKRGIEIQIENDLTI
jgi:hypothetical protein